VVNAKDTTYGFLAKSNFQKDWIERRGLLLMAAIYLGGVGGGLFIASVAFGWQTGLLLGERQCPFYVPDAPIKVLEDVLQATIFLDKQRHMVCGSIYYFWTGILF
jgi:hypothetical protein